MGVPIIYSIKILYFKNFKFSRKYIKIILKLKTKKEKKWKK